MKKKSGEIACESLGKRHFMNYKLLIYRLCSNNKHGCHRYKMTHLQESSSTIVVRNIGVNKTTKEATVKCASYSMYV